MCSGTPPSRPRALTPAKDASHPAAHSAPDLEKPAGKTAIYTSPSNEWLASIKGNVRTLTRRAKHRTLADLLGRLNPVLRGYCNCFRDGVCKRTFGYIDLSPFGGSSAG